MADWIPIVVAAMSLLRVHDGDTVCLPSGQCVRLLGLNTPELTAKCQPERTKARAARDRLAELLRKSGPVLTMNGKECAYGRPCALLMVDGRDVAEIMVAEGHAEPQICKAGCPKPKNWCLP